MKAKELSHIIKQGEGLKIEFKKAKNKLPKNLFETVCAFLNRSGGKIVLGLGDDKNILGIDSNSVEQLTKEIANLSNNAQKLFPTFLLEPQIIDYKEKKLIYIFIPISSQVHKTAGQIYDRSVDGDFVLKTDAQIKQIYNRKSTDYSENKIYPFLYENDFTDGIVDRVRKIIRIYRPNHPWNELSNKEFYKTSGLYRKDMITGKEGFTMSALLLFGKPEAIGSAIPHYKIDALVRIENLDRYDDRINIRHNLIETYDVLMAFVEKHLSDKFYLQGDQRISLREKIFREIIANILIHREYTNAFPTSFIIYKNKVVCKNANKPHQWGVLKPGNFEPFPKNPHIAQIFTQMGRSEELGTGIKNVFEYNKIYSNVDNNDFIDDDVFITTVPLKLFDNDVVDNVVDNVADNVVDEKLKKIIELIIIDNKISANSIADKLNISSRTVQRDLKKLRELNIIKRIGSDKGGHWEVIK